MDIDGINRVKGSYAEMPSETGQTSSVLFKREYFFVSVYITTFHKDFFFPSFFFFLDRWVTMRRRQIVNLGLLLVGYMCR